MSFARWPVHAIGSAILCGALLAACSGDSGPEEPAGTRVTLSFCTGNAPVWLAVQDGDAAWIRLLPRIAGIYDARFTANRGGVAFVSSGSSLTVAYGNLTELASIACTSGSNSLNGSVAGLASVERADVWFGTSFASVNAQNGRFQFRNVPDGQQDLFATRYTWSGDGGQIANRLVIRRAQNLSSGSLIAPINFGSSESFAPAFATASVAGADGAVSVDLISSWHGRAFSALLTYGTTPGPLLYSAVPQERLAPGELSSLQAFTSEQPGGRSATNYFSAPADRVVTMGPVLSTPVVTWPNTAPNQGPRLQLPSQPEYGRWVYVAYSQGLVAASVAVTSSYLGGTPATWDIEVPDLSSVDGWNAAWGFASSSNILWNVTAAGGPDRYLGDVVHDGDAFRSADFGGSNAAAGGTSRVTGRPEPHRGGFPQYLSAPRRAWRNW